MADSSTFERARLGLGTAAQEDREAFAPAGSGLLGKSGLASGHYAFPITPGASGTSATFGNGTYRASGRSMPGVTIARIGAIITAAGSAGCTLRLGIHKIVGGVPTTLVLDCGTVPADAIASPEITLATPLVLPEGDYAFGAVLQGAPASQPTIQTIGSYPQLPTSALLDTGTSAPASTATGVGWSATGVTGALPGSFGTPGFAGSAPRLFIRAA